MINIKTYFNIPTINIKILIPNSIFIERGATKKSLKYVIDHCLELDSVVRPCYKCGIVCNSITSSCPSCHVSAYKDYNDMLQNKYSISSALLKENSQLVLSMNK
jgi:heterodisulfide reductase subunit C